jgi:hypothetical protein
MLEQRRETEVVQHPMDIKFTHRLSYKQARLTVLVGFILGTLLSLLQIGIDYASEDASINREIQSLLEISHNPASRIAYNIDAELAQELTLGLLRSPAIIGATDGQQRQRAGQRQTPLQSGYRVISDFLFGAKRQFEDRLYLDHLPNESLAPAPGRRHLRLRQPFPAPRRSHPAQRFRPQPDPDRHPAGAVLRDADQAAGAVIRELSGAIRAAEPTTLECPPGHATTKSACWSKSPTSSLKTSPPKSSSGATPKTA